MRDSDKYELFVQQVIAETIGVEIHHQREFIGRVSGRPIKVDLAFTVPVVGAADVLVIVECKRYSSRVPADDVEELHSKMDDIGAHKGIIFTTVGFQRGSVLAAKGRGIALALLTDKAQPEEIAWVGNYAGAPSFASPAETSTCLLQGNLRGLFDEYEGATDSPTAVGFSRCW